VKSAITAFFSFLAVLSASSKLVVQPSAASAGFASGFSAGLASGFLPSGFPSGFLPPSGYDCAAATFESLDPSAAALVWAAKLATATTIAHETSPLDIGSSPRFGLDAGST
jgi:hypothetical protein